MLHLNILRVFEGANPCAMEPVVLMELQTADATWVRLAQGVDRLLQLWPTSDARHDGVCGVQRAGKAATASNLVQCAKTVLNEVRGNIYAAGASADEAGTVRVWLGYHDWRLSVEAWRWALESALALGQKPHDIESVESARQALLKTTRVAHPDYQIKFVMQAARERGLPVLPLVPESRVWQVGWGARRRIFFESATHADSMIGAMLARNKVAGKQFMAALGAPVLPHALVSKPEELAAAVKKVGWPCVAKPLSLGSGKGVTADLRSMVALEAAFAYARGFSNGPVMVERHAEGDDHRLLVIGGRLVSAVKLAPSFVLGDGQRSLRVLIDELNKARLRLQPENQHGVPVVEDEVFQRHLANQGLDLQGVPKAGQRVTMRSVSNLSMGGFLEYVSNEVHPRVRALAESIACASGLNAVGLDYITLDIRRDWHETPGAFVEINTTPGLVGLDVHPGRDPSWLGDVLLGNGVGRVPVAMVLVSRAEWSSWLPLLEALAADADVGCSGPQWVWANGMAWRAQGLNANQAALAMLRHATVERAVVVAVSEELVQFGFPLAGVERLFVLNDALPPEWQAVAQRVAHKVVQFDGLQALEHGLLDWMDCERLTGDDMTDGV